MESSKRAANSGAVAMPSDEEDDCGDFDDDFLENLLIVPTAEDVEDAAKMNEEGVFAGISHPPQPIASLEVDLNEDLAYDINHSFSSLGLLNQSSCFCHSFHLMVLDGFKAMKESKGEIAKVFDKCHKLASLSSQSSRFAEYLGKSIPTPGSTRWNSELRLVDVLINRIKVCKVNAALKSVIQEKKEKKESSDEERYLILSDDDVSRLKLILNLLSPVAACSDYAQSKNAVVSKVPSFVAATRIHFKEFIEKCESKKYEVEEEFNFIGKRHLLPMVKAMKSSLEDRFSGLFENIDSEDGKILLVESNVKFSDPIYIMASILDPSVLFDFHDKANTMLSMNTNHYLSSVKKLLHREAFRLTTDVSESSIGDCLEVSSQVSSLDDSTSQTIPLSTADFLRKKLKQTLPSTVRKAKKDRVSIEQAIKEEIEFYLDEAVTNRTDFLTFWGAKYQRFKYLSPVARKIASISMASANAERVFSLSGHIFGPRRTRMKPLTLRRAVMLKMNSATL